ncbi:SDR family NAD(P)-dependent oxidoreductase [Microbispora bryophytorum]|uniref:SDR family NAD(P)-dependent oxidoreductase n=1 Tax=Microbispora bryophytorum TaxID=1460882 RepID=UPI0033D968DB
MSVRKVAVRKVALVTGASSGIGAATAHRLAPSHHLILVARRADRLKELAAGMDSALVIAEDLTDPESAGRIAERVGAEHGRLDLLVNNAGAHFGGAFADTGWEHVHRSMEINFAAHVRMTGALLPLLRRSAPSAVVNVASVAGRIGLAHSGAYSAAKFALSGWTEALHAEERGHGVHVALVLPGFVTTEGFQYRADRASRRTRWMLSTPEVTARAIVAAATGRTGERYTPWPWWLLAAGRRLVPGLYRKAAPTIRA